MRERAATVDDVHEIASSMPHVTRVEGPKRQPGLSGRRQVVRVLPDPETRRVRPRHRAALSGRDHVWVESEDDKLALTQDPIRRSSPPTHFDGHLSVLVRACRLGEISRPEVARSDSGRVAVAGLEAPRREVARRQGGYRLPAFATAASANCMISQIWLVVACVCKHSHDDSDSNGRSRGNKLAARWPRTRHPVRRLTACLNCTYGTPARCRSQSGYGANPWRVS